MKEIALNKAQKQAVETIDGPMLVLAGPGTGKTQLLSARVAHILEKTDVNARNILCLTFTENGAQNMRDRLRSLIGEAAYDITIATYHSFGSDIIKNYAQYFEELAVDRSDDIRMERPVDELTQIQIVTDIINHLPFDSLMLGARYYVKDTVRTISSLKRALIDPENLRQIAADNLGQIDAAQSVIDDVVNSVGRVSAKKAEKFAQYAALLEGLSKLSGPLVETAAQELYEAHQKADEQNSPRPLSAWKDEWLKKDENDNFTLTEIARSQRMLELANIYEKYQKELQTRSVYDFDDMILRSIEAIKSNDELRFNLQEHYQYILLDEFQDTNPSQFELVKMIADHPVHEGRPNIMAVGDDDQAIFAFQGANVGNMQDFYKTFKDVLVINLSQNYRSHADILHVAHNISGQIEDRLHTQFEAIEKILEASSANLPKQATIARHEFEALASEYSWIARKTQSLIKNGVKASEIAVLSPKHEMLESIVPFFKNLDIPVSYEKRENVLETDIVKSLRLAAELVYSLSTNDNQLASQYFPRVLSQPYWQIKTADIWAVNWQYSRKGEQRSWAEIALESDSLKRAVTFYLSVANQVDNHPLEQLLDTLVGNQTVVDAGTEYTSPLKEFYFAQGKRSEDAFAYYEAISHLSVIRSHLRDYQNSSERMLKLADFLQFFEMYETAETPLINTHPIAQKADSVQLMTVYKAKGLEFDHVFIIQAVDDVWGRGSKGANNKLALPKNLENIRYTNSSDDERRRLLFVALTRARHSLYITSHSKKDTGKTTTPLKYLAEADGISHHLPEKYQNIVRESVNTIELSSDIETLWQVDNITLPADFKSLLKPRLDRYQMSPTHLNTFIDMEYGGPEIFLVQSLLRFPQAPTASGEYGTAVHNTLEWYQNRLNAGDKPNIGALLARYDTELNRRYLNEIDRDQARAKGRASLQKYMSARADIFKQNAQAEVNFYNEGVVLDGARLSGKIDRLEIDQQNKTLNIVDYKTGSPLKKWGNDMKSLKYRQQLYFYKLLIEKSSSWRDYKFAGARVEFVEASKNGAGEIYQPLELQYDTEEEAQFRKLVVSVWNLIQSLDLPDTSQYSANYKGSTEFIKALSEEGE